MPRLASRPVSIMPPGAGPVTSFGPLDHLLPLDLRAFRREADLRTAAGVIVHAQLLALPAGDIWARSGKGRTHWSQLRRQQPGAPLYCLDCQPLDCQHASIGAIFEFEFGPFEPPTFTTRRSKGAVRHFMNDAPAFATLSLGGSLYAVTGFQDSALLTLDVGEPECLRCVVGTLRCVHSSLLFAGLPDARYRDDLDAMFLAEAGRVGRTWPNAQGAVTLLSPDLPEIYALVQPDGDYALHAIDDGNRLLYSTAANSNLGPALNRALGRPEQS